MLQGFHRPTMNEMPTSPPTAASETNSNSRPGEMLPMMDKHGYPETITPIGGGGGTFADPPKSNLGKQQQWGSDFKKTRQQRQPTEPKLEDDPLPLMGTKKPKRKKKPSIISDEDTIDGEIERLEAQLRELKEAREQPEEQDTEEEQENEPQPQRQEEEQKTSKTEDVAATKSEPAAGAGQGSDTNNTHVKRKSAEKTWNKLKPASRFEMSDMRPNDFMGGGSWDAPGFTPMVAEKKRPSYRRRYEETDMPLVSLVKNMVDKDKSGSGITKPRSSMKMEMKPRSSSIVATEADKTSKTKEEEDQEEKEVALQSEAKEKGENLEDSFTLSSNDDTPPTSYYSFPGNADGELVFTNRNLSKSLSSLATPSPATPRAPRRTKSNKSSDLPRGNVTPTSSFNRKTLNQAPSSAPATTSRRSSAGARVPRNARNRDASKLAPPPLTTASAEDSSESKSKSSSSDSAERMVRRNNSSSEKKTKKKPLRTTKIKASKNDLKKLNAFLAQQQAEREDLNTVETEGAHIMDDSSADVSSHKNNSAGKPKPTVASGRTPPRTPAPPTATSRRGGKKPAAAAPMLAPTQEEEEEEEEEEDASKPAWARRKLRSTGKDISGDLAKPISAARMPVRQGDW